MASKDVDGGGDAVRGQESGLGGGREELEWAVTGGWKEKLTVVS